MLHHSTEQAALVEMTGKSKNLSPTALQPKSDYYEPLIKHYNAHYSRYFLAASVPLFLAPPATLLGFPELVVCLDCGTARFAVPEAELQ